MKSPSVWPGISSNLRTRPLNLTAKKSAKTKKISTELVKDGYKTLLNDLRLIREKELRQPNLLKTLEMPGDDVLPKLSGDLNFSKSKYLDKILYQLHERQPGDFEQLFV